MVGHFGEQWKEEDKDVFVDQPSGELKRRSSTTIG